MEAMRWAPFHLLSMMTTAESSPGGTRNWLHRGGGEDGGGGGGGGGVAVGVGDGDWGGCGETEEDPTPAAAAVPTLGVLFSAAAMTTLATDDAPSSGKSSTAVFGSSCGSSCGRHNFTWSGASSAHCTPVALLSSSFLSVMKYTLHGSVTRGTGVKAVRQVWQKKRLEELHASQKTRPPSDDTSERAAWGERMSPLCMGGNVNSGRRREICTFPNIATASSSFTSGTPALALSSTSSADMVAVSLLYHHFLCRTPPRIPPPSLAPDHSPQVRHFPRFE